MIAYTFLAIMILFALSFGYSYRKAIRSANGSVQNLHSLPGYHGGYVAAWVGVPSLFFVLIWLLFQESVINQLLIASLPANRIDGLSDAQLNLLLVEIKQISRGNIFGQPDSILKEAADRYLAWREIAKWAMFSSTMALCAAGFFFASSRISPEFRARHGVERILTYFMIGCSVAAILTTLGIVLSLLWEAMRFFARVPLSEFLFGLRWEPQIALRADQLLTGGTFGAVPVFLGTLLIAAAAMAIATPIGLLIAIYFAEYANKNFRSVVKPLIEILSGIPTVVYGFFAVLVVAPNVKAFLANAGIDMAPNSAMIAGGVMGIMLIPFISSLSDDALNAVPRAMRDGSYAMGATKGETIIKVLLPAALPGIIGGILLAVSRAIGETMIVLMAAGIIATLTLNPLEPVTTVTVQIVTLLIGDTEFDNPKTLAAFALGLVLFLVTLVLNVIALRIVQKYREKYD
jgi:phosphate transport system permease protein